MKVLARAPRDNSSHISKKFLDHMQNLQRRLSKAVSHQVYMQVKSWIGGKYFSQEFLGMSYAVQPTLSQGEEWGVVVITTTVHQCWVSSTSGHQRYHTPSAHLGVRDDGIICFGQQISWQSTAPHPPLPLLQQLQKHFFLLFNSTEALQLINMYAKCLKEKILTISE